MELEDDAPINPLSLITGASNNVQKLMTSYVIGKNFYYIAKRYYDKYKQETSYTVSLSDTDSIYPEVSSWLLDRIPNSKQRSLSAVTYKPKANRYGEITDDEPIKKALGFRYDGSRAQTVVLNGHKIRVTTSTDNPSFPTADGNLMKFKGEEKILFTGNSLEARDAIIGFLQEIAHTQNKKPPVLKIAKSWGNWGYIGKDVPQRRLDSVVLREGQKEAILDDLRNFLSQEDTYVRLGVPYHRGYLFHGPPGTGKTSLANALATEVGLDVYYLPLPAMSSDTNLNDMMQEITPRSILLIEDIDVVHGAKDRDDDHKGVSLSGLLNALDGFVTPHGLITIMTTNNKEVLDSALIRPGRVDRTEKIDYIDDHQLNGLLLKFCNLHTDYTTDKDITPAQVIEVILKNLDDEPGIRKGIEALI